MSIRDFGSSRRVGRQRPTMTAMVIGFVLGYCGTAMAQASDPAGYPNRPVRLLVPYAPGGTSDAVARIIGPKLSELTGQNFVIDNRPGASGTLGRGMVAKSVPDGYTLLIGDSTHAINPHVMRIAYDAVAAFDPITLFAITPQVLVVNSSFKAQTLKEFIAIAKAQPGKLNYGSGGSGSLTNLTGELFKLTVPVDLTHVPYKSIGLASADLLGNQIHLAFPSLPGVVPHVKAGRLRALAVANSRRSKALPNVPTFEESGVSGMVVLNWLGAMAPAGIPKAVMERIHGEMVRAVHAKDVQERFSAIALEPETTTPAEFKSLLQSEYERWGRVVKQAGVKLE